MGKGMFPNVGKTVSPSIVPKSKGRDPLEKHEYPISDDLMFEICSLVHKRWSEAFDALKVVTSERSDGTSDWKAFHEERVKRATECERIWKRRLDEAATLFGSILKAE